MAEALLPALLVTEWVRVSKLATQLQQVLADPEQILGVSLLKGSTKFLTYPQLRNDRAPPSQPRPSQIVDLDSDLLTKIISQMGIVTTDWHLAIAIIFALQILMFHLLTALDDERNN